MVVGPGQAFASAGWRGRIASAWSGRRCRAVLAASLGIQLLAHCGAVPDEASFVSIFDGKALTDWRAVPADLGAAWSVQDGAIQGAGLQKRLSSLVYSADEDLRDFDLRFSYRMLTDGNTGVELRAREDTTGKRPFEGYHADLGHVGIGPRILGAWDFHFATRTEFPCERGTRLIIDEVGNPLYERIEDPVRIEDIRPRDWNHCQIRARGDHFQFFINRKLSSEFTDGIGKGRLDSGSIALQLHDDRTIVQFKDILLKRLR